MFLRYLVVAWSILWFAVIVPGHQRGAILLPGADRSGSTASASRQAIEDALPPCCRSHGPSEKNGTPAPLGSGCAICDQVAKITPPVEYDFKPMFLGFLEMAPPPAIFTLSGVQFLSPRDARGPPAAV